MKRLRFLLILMTLAFGFAAVNARAQSAHQVMSFSLLTDYQDETNDAPTNPQATNLVIHPLLITGQNILKAIMLDVKGHAWTNWAGATIQRQINLTNGEEGIYVTLGGLEEVNVSQFFSETYVSNFTWGVTNYLGFLTNSFTYGTNLLQSPFLPEYNGYILGSTTHHGSSASLHFISLNTTNLKFNLVGCSLQTPGDGTITTFDGIYDKTNHYSVAVQREMIYVVGSFVWNATTNFYTPVTNVTNVFYSGPVRGNMIIQAPFFNPLTPLP
ncbi:MAG TPA: hypothetical protein VH619_09180 [Verrucomicrobiae bacterium]|jgi:hypothetical protein|nr:hypothetical protein [Verrucomicrobiae bacterium]